MGCVTSNLLKQQDELGLGQHIVSLTSTTYGLLSLEPTPPSEAETKTEVINSWELMAGLDADSFRFQRICPPKGENRVVIYTTSLRGVRSTFEACNAVRAVFEAMGVLICERDVSMDSGFKEELRDLLLPKGQDKALVPLPPQVFVKGMYIGGAEEMAKLVEDEALLRELLHGLPRKKLGSVCQGCGDMRFLPCFSCNGSTKRVLLLLPPKHQQGHSNTTTLVVNCSLCNENGLVLCPICS